MDINYLFHHVGCVFCFHVLQNKAIMERVTNLSDMVVGLESFIGSERETNPLYKDYHGEFHLQQGTKSALGVSRALSSSPSNWVSALKQRLISFWNYTS